MSWCAVAVRTRRAQSVFVVLCAGLLVTMVAIHFGGLLPGTRNFRPKDFSLAMRQAAIDDSVRWQRLRRAFDVCSKMPSKSPWTPRGYLHREKSLFYCKIPKVSSTFMEGFLPRIFNSSNMEESFITVGSKKSPPKTGPTNRIPLSFSYLVVREPYGRLFSAYENKLFLPNKFWLNLGKDIIKTVRGDKGAAEFGHDVKFYELIEYVISKYKRRETLNGHLKSMHELCDPCQVQFNYIGKLESMQNDLESLVDLWKEHGVVNTTGIAQDVTHVETETRMTQMFGPIPKLFTIVQQTKGFLSRRNLFLRTWASYQIRGHVLKEFEMPFQNVFNVTQRQYREALKSALEKSKGRKEELRLQREEAQIQAFRTVPIELMWNLRYFVLRDCQLFGYDDMPDKLFNRTTTPVSDFNYFKGMSIS